MSFENIIGNESIKELLTQSVKSDNILHSYMFIGNEGIGKLLFAKEFAKMILCLGEKENSGCKSCIEFESNNHPDFSIIDSEENSIKIEQIRLMQNKIAEKPIVSNKKVYIINNAQIMTKDAQNCLLKTLEEPPEYVTIILICSNENLMLNTIKSRCTKINFQKISDEKLKDYILKNNILSNVTENIITMLDGSIGKAYKISEKIETYEELGKNFERIKTTDKLEFMRNVETIYKLKDNIQDVLEYINVELFNLSKKDNKYINCISFVEKAKNRLKANSNFDMTIDNMLLNIWEEINEKYSRS